MVWQIECTASCGKRTKAENIVALIGEHLDSDGWILCPCGKQGYIYKRFDLQEVGEVWEPYLRGVVPLGERGGTYQPFVFLVSHEPNGKVDHVWFSYYKDLRSVGGKLKLGYGPGGPPVLGRPALLSLLSRLVQTRCLQSSEVVGAVEG